MIAPGHRAWIIGTMWPAGAIEVVLRYRLCLARTRPSPSSARAERQGTQHDLNQIEFWRSFSCAASPSSNKSLVVGAKRVRDRVRYA